MPSMCYVTATVQGGLRSHAGAPDTQTFTQPVHANIAQWWIQAWTMRLEAAREAVVRLIPAHLVGELPHGGVCIDAQQFDVRHLREVGERVETERCRQCRVV